GPNMLVVNPELPAKDVRELIALLKASPGKYSFASSGNGTSQHLSGELFKTMTGVEMQHIPYRGSPPALADVVGGQVAMTFDNITTAWPLVKGGQIARARRDDREAISDRAGRSNPRGVGTPRLRDRFLAGRLRAGRGIDRDRQAAQHRDRPNHQRTRRPAEARRHGRRAGAEHPGGIRGDGE